MNRLKALIRGFFGFSRTETNGFLILLPLCIIMVFIEPIYQTWFTNKNQNNADDIALLDSLTTHWEFTKSNDTTLVVVRKKLRFKFDPNKADIESLQALGFEKNVALRIINFRAKGGSFKSKTDLKKIYGIDTSLVIELYPYCLLPETVSANRVAKIPLTSGVLNNTLAVIDINLADTTALIKLKGIGSKLAQRIIKYRERLGGFVSVHQFKEVYGLDSLAIKELSFKTKISNDFKPRQIDINRASEKELTSLPYIKFSIAKAIVAYRYQHKKFTSVDDIRNIAVLEEKIFQKIKPYLVVKD